MKSECDALYMSRLSTTIALLVLRISAYNIANLDSLWRYSDVEHSEYPYMTALKTDVFSV